MLGERFFHQHISLQVVAEQKGMLTEACEAPFFIKADGLMVVLPYAQPDNSKTILPGKTEAILHQCSTNFETVVFFADVDTLYLEGGPGINAGFGIGAHFCVANIGAVIKREKKVIGRVDQLSGQYFLRHGLLQIQRHILRLISVSKGICKSLRADEG